MSKMPGEAPDHEGRGPVRLTLRSHAGVIVAALVVAAVIVATVVIVGRGTSHAPHGNPPGQSSKRSAPGS
jgi:hypothetical protein